MQGDEHRGTLGTVRNATLLLSLLAEGPAYNQLTDLAERSGMSLPTVHRLLRSLALAGLVEQDPRSLRYGLGPEIVRLSERYLDRLPTLRALSPYLRELRDTTKTTILVALLVRTSIIYVDRVDGEEGAGVFRESHRVHQALDTAAGRLLLARGGPELWAEALDRRVRPSNRDRRSWADAPFLLLGPDGDRPMAEVAVPVLDRAGQPLAALCARGDPGAFPDDVLRNDVAPQLVRAARAAGRAMADG
ncbi:MAG TPA: helix-turn-helix domain-containing protein [Acidimicrobiia bacterium]|nr:helix-turn-helix domain-containing protein [Acidimicrobiia bacterium]HMC80536.1 helix-turn-helix domain-containing protein [Acidimicrobiia bacterium]HTC81002.1 helix-turn-helix domain-containing protein [Acidimicrobiia bacterium]